MSDETKDEAKKGGRICPSCGKEMGADHKGGTSAQGLCPRCGAPCGEGEGKSCSCTTGSGGG